ncbi:MAG: hypothetical protein ACJA1L_000999 [Paracoccaceae bacterium]|jgi:hypothetical protein
MLSIEGNTATGASRLFGIVADLAKMTLCLNITINKIKTDNIAYDLASAFNLPTGLLPLLVSLGGLPFVARRHKVA